MIMRAVVVHTPGDAVKVKFRLDENREAVLYASALAWESMAALLVQGARDVADLHLIIDDRRTQAVGAAHHAR